MPSLRQFSRMAGVSASTVSRVFSGAGPVAPETEKRIIELAEAVGFRPSPVARAAFGRRTRSVGVLLPSLRISYFADIAKGIQRQLLTNDYLPMVLDSQEDEERRAVRRLIDHRVDGLIINLVDEGLRPDDFAELFRAGLPMVLLGPVTAELSADRVSLDDIQGGELIGQHLSQLGHRRFGFTYFGEGHSPSDLRLEGFRRAIAAYGGQLAERDIIWYLPRLPDFASREKAFEEHLTAILTRPDRPTAIFASNDTHAQSVYRVARPLGVRIPEDLSVVGFSNLNFSEFMEPGLTTVDTDGAAVGEDAAKLILDRLASPQRCPQSVLLPTSLIVRGSTAVPPGSSA